MSGTLPIAYWMTGGQHPRETDSAARDRKAARREISLLFKRADRQ
jgi:hypothetical protein